MSFGADLDRWLTTQHMEEDIMAHKAYEYAEELRQSGRNENVEVYRYRTPINNYPETDRRWGTYDGYAVRFSTTSEEDARINKGTTATSKFHDRSIVVFTDDETGIPMDKLWPDSESPRAYILADIPGEPVTPYWIGWRSPFEDSDMHDPSQRTVGFKRTNAHKAGDNYAHGNGPRKYYHLIMERDDA